MAPTLVPAREPKPDVGRAAPLSIDGQTIFEIDVHQLVRLAATQGAHDRLDVRQSSRSTSTSPFDSQLRKAFMTD